MSNKRLAPLDKLGREVVRGNSDQQDGPREVDGGGRDPGGQQTAAARAIGSRDDPNLPVDQSESGIDVVQFVTCHWSLAIFKELRRAFTSPQIFLKTLIVKR